MRSEGRRRDCLRSLPARQILQTETLRLRAESYPPELLLNQRRRGSDDPSPETNAQAQRRANSEYRDPVDADAT